MDFININLGIFGHIDHGKTTLSKVLTEIASTSALDKLPESQKRGITIDIGFSSFKLENYRVTLVDSPGHADLIRAVVSAADIIDLALIVVDAKEGPKTQTGEHMLILDHFNIPTIVVMTKVDNANPDEINRTKLFMQTILKSTKNLKESLIIPISAKTDFGISELKNTIFKTLNDMEIVRKTDSYFKMPIDHAFPIKGAGTVVTGTIIKGTVKIGDELRIIPINIGAKVRSIQCFKESVTFAKAGDRVGMAIQGVDSKQIYRGCILTSKDTKLQAVNKIVAKIRVSDIFKYNLTPKMKVHLNVGMLIVPAVIVPFKKVDFRNYTENVILDEVVSGNECYCAFELEEKVLAEFGDRVLITRLDLPPTTLRICGHGVIEEFKPIKDLNIKKEVLKEGNIKVDKGRTVIEGLSESKVAAEKLIGEEISIVGKDIVGKIKSTFGTKGLLMADFNGNVENRDKINLKRLRRWG
ncbi:selenocysteine-specific translation elongation factor [Methanococcus vannielii SB]|uniref:Selenocysteine-specific elongation factor n=1 Tax=Methanococcus vannielii (strain ATCC 35089 / DSM 1224 / JCM 13029 / OCM 148 / SB) TaxID=406327 RepID=A6UPY1_METVS|nr:selenocysteine-specific translation elongation factor [Methanococcus vannielii]ABR54553.1 selenocysteine-specific translation elongation factor [Methanococcus vannielii SB]